MITYQGVVVPFDLAQAVAGHGFATSTAAAAIAATSVAIAITTESTTTSAKSAGCAATSTSKSALHARHLYERFDPFLYSQKSILERFKKDKLMRGFVICGVCTSDKMSQFEQAAFVFMAYTAGLMEP